MRIWLAVAAVNGALAVAAGAFAAHGLKGLLTADRLAVFETAARYHMYHALAMGLAALAAQSKQPAPAGTHQKGSNLSPALFLGGIVLFCGSLYVLALTGITWLGAITPLGGVLFIAGWIWLCVCALRRV